MKSHVGLLTRPATRWVGVSMLLASAGLVGLVGMQCPPAGDGDVPGMITEDTTLETLILAAGETLTVENGAVLRVTGDSTIDGTIEALDGLLTLILEGAATINGTLKSTAGDSALGDDDSLSDQPFGINLIVGDGEVTIGEDAIFDTSGNLVVSDDETVLDMTPGEFFDQVEDVASDEMTTLVPLPPDDPAFDEASQPAPNQKIARQQSGASLPPILIQGTWPPAGVASPPGDKSVIIFRFNGNRTLNLGNWTVNGPPAPNGDDDDASANPGNAGNGGNGKNGMRLNVWNNGGPINVVGAVVFNLADGGDGGEASSVCGDATGGDGGKSGNFRMTASGGIDLTNGTLVINPGLSGNGGAATVTKGAAGAAGCPGAMGDGGEATGGNGADNNKRIYVRGNVTALANISLGFLIAGDGGAATSEACDGGPGIACCDGGPGGNAGATGGNGGGASLNVGGFPITVSTVFAGDGGTATATGGNGGPGGDCKFFDAGDGGDGGAAEATGGSGGDASNTAGPSVGGNGGDASGTGGDGGSGGDSGFGTPGAGGDLGTGTANAGPAGAGGTAGTAGEADGSDGGPGAAGGALAVRLFCLPFGFLVDGSGVVDPGPHQGPVFADDNTTEIGDVTIDLAGTTLESQLLSNSNPVDQLGLQSGAMLTIDVSSLNLTDGTEAGEIGGIRIEPLFGNGVDEANPLVVQALDANGEVLDQQNVTSLADNFANPSQAESVDVLFNLNGAVVDRFQLTTPPNSFVTLIRIYILDP